MIDSTPAKIGRSMKKRERFMGFSSSLAAPLRPFGACASIGTVCGATGAPGRTRWSPFTTITSPGLRPDSITRSPSTSRPIFTSR